MGTGSRILGIIPARGGSKRIPRKNLACLGGKPLIVFTIEAAAESNLLTRTVVSTEDEEIRQVAIAHGAEIPFLRPVSLASDSVRSVDVVLHALSMVEHAEGKVYDYVCLLEPTAPFRTAEDIDAALTLLLEEGTDSVMGLTPVDYADPGRLRVMHGTRAHLWVPERWREGQPRQAMEPMYKPAGGLFACRRDVVVGQRSLHGQSQCGYVFPAERALDIDTGLDFAFAEFLLQRQALSGKGATACRDA